jgi:hypothetical protein
MLVVVVRVLGLDFPRIVRGMMLAHVEARVFDSSSVLRRLFVGVTVRERHRENPEIPADRQQNGYRSSADEAHRRRKVRFAPM